jgi:hypothetical protein
VRMGVGVGVGERERVSESEREGGVRGRESCAVPLRELGSIEEHD